MTSQTIVPKAEVTSPWREWLPVSIILLHGLNGKGKDIWCIYVH